MKRNLFFTFVLLVALMSSYVLPAHADSVPDVVVKLSVVSDGTPSFDVGAPDPDQPGGAGLDAGANNGIVKTQDSSVINVDWATGDIAVTGAVLSVVAPAGMSFVPSTSVPGSCLNGSTYDSAALSCILGDVSGGASGSFPLTLMMGSVANASAHDITATIASNEAPLATSNVVTLVASSAPKVDLKINYSTDVPVIKDFVNPGTLESGRILLFPVTMEVPGDGKGSEPLNPTEPLDFRIDISALPSSAEMVPGSWVFPGAYSSTQRCGANNSPSSNVPFGKIGVATSATASNSVVDSGSWTCSYNGGLDAIDVQVTGADLAPGSFPSYGSSPFASFGSRRIILSGVVPVFINDTELFAIAGGFFPSFGFLPNVVASWINDPNGVSGVANTSENPANNTNGARVDYTFDGIANTRYMNTPNILVGDNGGGLFRYLNTPTSFPSLPGHKPYVPTQTQDYNKGDGTVSSGQKFQISVELGGSNSPPQRLGACVQLSPGQSLAPQADTKVIDFNAVGNLESFITGAVPPITYESNGGEIVLSASFVLTSGGAIIETPLSSSDYVVEYSTDPHSNLDVEADCSDLAKTWSSTPPAALSDVTQVRIIMLRDTQQGEQITFGIGMVALPGVVGTKIFHTLSASSWAAGTPFVGSNPWTYKLGTDYTVGAYCTLPGNPPDPGQHNDCLTLGGPTLELNKSVVGANRNLKPYDVVQFEVTGYVVGPIPGTAENVVIDDVLPAGLEFTGVSSISPTTGGANGDSTASWDFGQVANGSVLSITYDVRILPGFSAFENFQNTATINGDYDDGGGLVALDTQSIQANVQASGPFSEVQTLKTTSDPLIVQNGDLLFNLSYENTGTAALGSLDIIDIIPYVGDGRTPPSAFSGTTSLASVTSSGAEDIFYTVADPSTIVVDGDDPSNAIPGGSTIWCEPVNVTAAPDFGSAGCPSVIGDSTAFRLVRSAPFNVGDLFDADVVINTSGNTPGDIYTNDFAVRAGGLALPALSNDVSVEVEGGDLAIAKTVRNSPVRLGDNAVFDIAITNNGTIAADNVVVRDVLPQGLEFVSATSGGTNSGGTVTWTIPSIAVGETVIVTVTAKTTAVSPGITNVASVISSSTPLKQTLLVPISDDAVVEVLALSSSLPITGANVFFIVIFAVILIGAGLFLKKSSPRKQLVGK